jgi:urease alpha subunit
MRHPIAFAALMAAFGLTVASPARAQDADTVLVNGTILAVDAAFSTHDALAVRGGKIVAIGRTADIRKLAGSGTRTIDLNGRTVIPGLIDSHMHATRAALSFSTEVNWIGPDRCRCVVDGGGGACRGGAWLVVVTPPRRWVPGAPSDAGQLRRGANGPVSSARTDGA